jgi:hypothetical protein
MLLENKTAIIYGAGGQSEASRGTTRQLHEFCHVIGISLRDDNDRIRLLHAGITVESIHGRVPERHLRHRIR